MIHFVKMNSRLTADLIPEQVHPCGLTKKGCPVIGQWSVRLWFTLGAGVFLMTELIGIPYWTIASVLSLGVHCGRYGNSQVRDDQGFTWLTDWDYVRITAMGEVKSRGLEQGRLRIRPPNLSIWRPKV